MIHLKLDTLKQRSRRTSLLTNTGSMTTSKMLKKSKRQSTRQPKNLNVRLNPLLHSMQQPGSPVPQTPKSPFTTSTSATPPPLPPPPPPLPPFLVFPSGHTHVPAPISNSSSSSSATMIPTPTISPQSSTNSLTLASPHVSGEITFQGKKDNRASIELSFPAIENLSSSADDTQSIKDEHQFRIDEDLCNKPFDKQLLQYSMQQSV